QAALLAAWKAMEDRIAELEAVVRDLQARLQLNSTNSSKPPSSDPIGLKRKPPAPPSSRKHGEQPGHREAFRALVPPEKLRSSTDQQCRGARRAARGDLVSDQRGHGRRAGEPVRRADVDCGRHVPAPGAERAGVPDLLLRGSSERPSDPLPLAGDSTEDRSRLIPAISPYEPVLDDRSHNHILA